MARGDEGLERVLDATAWFHVECASAVDFLSVLPTGSVSCCVTSPPYWSQRAYNVKGQVGLEASPKAYVKKLVHVMSHVWRVLAPAGTLWLNLGDAFAGGGYSNHRINGEKWQHELASDKRRSRQQTLKKACENEGIMPKEIIGLPWMVAFALREAGWRLRSDIIWAKGTSGERREGACMPESVRDRPTRAHEYLFLLTKSSSYYDSTAVAETGNLRSVWRFAPAKSKASCSAVMPEGLARLCVLAGCPRGGIVLDPFAGSGTTGAVALRDRRRFVGCDVHPKHVEEARARLSSGVDLYDMSQFVVPTDRPASW